MKTHTENVWQRKTEMKLVPGEKGDEDNWVCLYEKMKWAKDHFLALRPRVVVQPMSIKLNSLISLNKVLTCNMCIGNGS